jgi:predicted transcriptional regulator
MTLVNTKEFVSNQKKYFDMAINEQVFIKRGKNTFIITCADKGEDEIGELKLAKERKESGGEYTNTSDFIKYLRK